MNYRLKGLRRIKSLTPEQKVDELLELWTGKSREEQYRTMNETSKGSSWRRKLAEESRDHMLTIAQQMTPSYVIGTVNDMRTVVEIASLVM